MLDPGDCNFSLARHIDRPVRITFEKGRATAIEGGLDAMLIREALRGAGDEGAWNAGHIAWGLDPRALWTQPISQTPDTGGGADIESFRGAVQVQLGSNDDVAFGGSNSSRAHLGLCLRGASLFLDDDPVVLDGDLHA